MSKWILRILVIVGLVYIAYAILFYSKIGPGDQIPDFKITSVNGKTYDSKDLKPKLYLLHFWANWCSACVPELDELNRLHKLMGADLDIVAIHEGATEEDRAKVRYLVNSKKLEYGVYLDAGEVGDLFGVRMFPESFLVDKNGVVLKKIFGVVKWSNPGKVQMLKDLIKGGDRGEN